MRALSVKNPWAALIAAGRKSIELRTWSTSYRGPIVIVSSAQPDRIPAAKAWGKTWCDAPTSRAVALVELLNVRPAAVDDAERACCAVPGGYNAWELRLVRALSIDRHVKGQLGLFSCPADLHSVIGGESGVSDLDLATIEARAAARPLRDNDGHEDFEALLAEVKRLRGEVERLKGLKPELPPFPPAGAGLPRYGLRWPPAANQAPLAVPMDDGYWTPAHLAEAEVERLTQALSQEQARRIEAQTEVERLTAERDRFAHEAAALRSEVGSLKQQLSAAMKRENEAQTEVERLKKEERNAFFTAAELGRVMGRLRAAGIGAEWVVGEMLHKVAPYEGVEVLVTERDAALATAARLREAAERVLRLEHGTTTTTGDYEEYLRYQADKAKAWADLRAALADSEPVARWLAEHDAKVRAAALERLRFDCTRPDGESACHCCQRRMHRLATPPPTEPTCATCGKPATCIGRYEDMTEDDPACDDCCGHGNEDGRCEPITCARCGGKGDDPEHAGACGDCAGTRSKP